MSQSIDKEVLPEALWGRANDLLKGLSRDQILWLGGYLSGIGLSGEAVTYGQNGQNGHATATIAAKVKLKVLVGSHSGNGKWVAQLVEAKAASAGIEVVVESMADYKTKQIKNEQNLLVIVSTHGEGEPPVAAEDLYQLLDTKRAGDLSAIKYSVIALGDSSYKNFCQTGIDFHDRLKLRGAQALIEPQLLDVDFKDHIETLLDKLLPLYGGVASVTDSKVQTAQQASVSSNGIFQAEVIQKILLNGRGSDKETYHLELSLEDSGLTYQPGDALEVFANNEDQLVDGVLNKLAIDGNEQVSLKNELVSLREALKYHRELTVVTLPVLKKLSAFADEPSLNELLDNSEDLDNYLYGRDLLDVLSDYTFKLSAAQLVESLRPLPPRAYSIASSQAEVEDEVHLTIGAVRYTTNNRQHNGLCSTFVADRLQVDEKVAVRIKSNEGFRLPAAEAPVIMVGPGTGIAPFRAFLQERSENGGGENWLFFGDQHFESDFLYQTELLKYRKDGVLTHLDVAFSRDQEEKIYVQNRLLEKADEVYSWLQKGAYIYVCGDKNRMAKDVKSAFAEILQQKGGVSPEDAEKQLAELRKNGRYQEDVY